MTEIATPSKLLDWVQIYGLGTVLSIVLVAGFFWILAYVLRENTKREERLAEVLGDHISHMKNDILESKNLLSKQDIHLQELREASKFQRDEHREIVTALQALQREIAGIR